MHKGIRKIDKKEYAIKIIDKKKSTEQRINNEIQILSNIFHPNIIKYKDVFKTNEKIFLVTEIADGGQLLFFIYFYLILFFLLFFNYFLIN